jgi:hypothetical protein
MLTAYISNLATSTGSGAVELRECKTGPDSTVGAKGQDTLEWDRVIDNHIPFVHIKVLAKHGKELYSDGEERWSEVNSKTYEYYRKLDLGEVIGFVGGQKNAPGAGKTSGAHLHFQVGPNTTDLYDESKNYDPQHYTEGYWEPESDPNLNDFS